MKCEDVMAQYLSLDLGERVPFKVCCHLLFCAKCRKTVQALKMAERVSSLPLSVPSPVTSEAVNAVLEKAGVAEAKSKLWPGRMTMPSWIIVGVLMLVSMAAFVTGTGGVSIVLDKAVGLVFALLVTLYWVAFVSGNIDYFVKKTGVGLAA